MSLDLSDLLPVSIEVSQGSVLGPLFSFVYLNNLATVVNESSNVNMYVANTEVDSTAKPGCSTQLYYNVNSDFCKFKHYFVINKFILNIQKRQFMLIGTHHSNSKMADFRIGINNEPLQRVLVPLT